MGGRRPFEKTLKVTHTLVRNKAIQGSRLGRQGGISSRNSVEVRHSLNLLAVYDVILRPISPLIMFAGRIDNTGSESCLEFQATFIKNRIDRAGFLS